MGGAAAWIVVSVLKVLGHFNLPLPQQLSCWQERFEKQLQVRLFGCMDWEKDSRNSKAVPRLMVVSEERERGAFVAPLQVSQHISRHSLESTASFPPPLSNGTQSSLSLGGLSTRVHWSFLPGWR